MANNFEARTAGSAALANNLAARLDGARDDALYANVLFLFLGAPGVVLAALITAALAGAGRDRRMREQALLRMRGATLIETLVNPAVEAAVIGLAGAAGGLLLAFIALRLMEGSVAAPTALFWGLFAAAAGLAFAFATIVVPVARDARVRTVAQTRVLVEATTRPLWERLWLDITLLAAAGSSSERAGQLAIRWCWRPRAWRRPRSTTCRSSRRSRSGWGLVFCGCASRAAP